SINYAINGTVNYRTLEPTVKAQESADFGTDQYGGNVASIRATGTLPGGRLSYAFGFVTEGTQGFDRGLTSLVGLPCGNVFLDGQPVNLYVGGTFGSPADPRIFNSFYSTTDRLICC